MPLQRLDGRLGQGRAEGEGHVGGVDHLEHRQLQRLGQALAAEGRIGREAVPAPFGEGAVGFREAIGRHHLAVLEPRALLVAHPVQRRQHPGRQLAGRLQHRVHHRLVQALDQRLQPPEPRRRLQREGDIADRSLISHARGLLAASTILAFPGLTR